MREPGASAQSLDACKYTQTGKGQLYDCRFNGSCFPLGEVIPIGYQCTYMQTGKGQGAAHERMQPCTCLLSEVAVVV